MIGNVRIRFIVDTTGRMVVSSFKVLFATAPEFADAIQSIIGDWKFFPAKRAGELVRQVVCMPVDFRVSGARDLKQLDSQVLAWRAHPGCPSPTFP